MGKMRLVDAGPLEEFFDNKAKSWAGTWSGPAYSTALERVKDAPTVDAAPVVHGQWEKAEYGGFVRCDKCKDVYIDESWLTDGKWNYCPNCGAKMDGE